MKILPVATGFFVWFTSNDQERRWRMWRRISCSFVLFVIILGVGCTSTRCAGQHDERPDTMQGVSPPTLLLPVAPQVVTTSTTVTREHIDTVLETVKVRTSSATIGDKVNIEVVEWYLGRGDADELELLGETMKKKNRSDVINVYIQDDTLRFFFVRVVDTALLLKRHRFCDQQREIFAGLLASLSHVTHQAVQLAVLKFILLGSHQKKYRCVDRETMWADR